MRTFTIGIAVTMSVLLASNPRAQQTGNAPAATAAPSAPVLVPTNHPRVPLDLSRLWLVPDRSRPVPATFNNLATAIKLESAGEFARALTLLAEPALLQGPLGTYAAYYAAEASLKLGRSGDALRAFQALEARQPVGYLAQAAAIGVAEAHEAQDDFLAAVSVYERLLKDNFGPADESADASRAGRSRRRRHDQGGGHVRARLLRLRVERTGAGGRPRADAPVHAWSDRAGKRSLQEGAGARRADFWREALRTSARCV